MGNIIYDNKPSELKTKECWNLWYGHDAIKN